MCGEKDFTSSPLRETFFVKYEHCGIISASTNNHYHLHHPRQRPKVTMGNIYLLLSLARVLIMGIFSFDTVRLDRNSGCKFNVSIQFAQHWAGLIKILLTSFVS
jgi:hypothetical protein